MTTENWQWIYDINFLSVVEACQFAGRHMLAAGSGHIINISSVLALGSIPGAAGYCSSKTAVKGITENLACEWVRHNVCVNSIASGWFITDLNRKGFEREEKNCFC